MQGPALTVWLYPGWVKYRKSGIEVPTVVNILLASRRGTLQPISIWVGWLRAHNTISSKLSRRTDGAWPQWLYTKVRLPVLVKACRHEQHGLGQGTL